MPPKVERLKRVKRGRYANTAEMARDTADDRGAAERAVREMGDRCVIDLLMSQRAVLGMSQKDIAEKMGCTQSRVSKLEGSKDDDLPIGAFRDYAAALGLEMSIVLSKRSARPTVVDQVKYHTFAIRRLLNRLVKLAGGDNTMVEGTKNFCSEVIVNTANIVFEAHKALNKNLESATKNIKLPELSAGTRPVVQMEDEECDDQFDSQNPCESGDCVPA